MSQINLESIIVAELKELRKGRGLLGTDMSEDLLIKVAFGRNYGAMLSGIEQRLQSLGDDQEVGALLNALAIGSPKVWRNLTNPPADDLTRRRRLYSEKSRISERTLARYEDEAIRRLAALLAQRFSEAPHADRIALFLDSPAGERIAETAPRVEHRAVHRSQVSDDPLPEDVPSLIQHQAETIDELLDVVADLTQKLVNVGDELKRVQAANAKVAKTWGIPLE
ncbi:hypothetical protein [Mycolicibacterium sp. A43C]